MCARSGHPKEALPWIEEVKLANSVDDLKTLRSFTESKFPNYETLDARIATALKKILQNSNFKK